MINKDNIASCVNYNPRPEWERWTGSNICPRCCSDEIEYNTQLILTSNSPRVQLRCKKCDFYFDSGVKAEWINEDALDKVWEHVKDVFGIPEIRDPLPGEAPYIGDWPTPDFPPLDIEKATVYGWICPKCGRVLAPHVGSCPYCSPATTINITYSGE